MPRAPLNRRTFLRSAGVCIGLPFLDAMLPVGLGAGRSGARPKRMLLVGRPLGLYAPYFFPEEAGKDYMRSRYLEPLAEYRRDFTVFSGLSHDELRQLERQLKRVGKQAESLFERCAAKGRTGK